MAEENFDKQFNELLRMTGSKKDADLARYLDKSPQAIADARRKRAIPAGWIVQVQEMTGEMWPFVANEEPEKIRYCRYCAEINAKYIAALERENELLRELREAQSGSGRNIINKISNKMVQN